ncbi:MAG: redoxin domain-containing protein [Spirosomataceae bacterium]
MLFNHLHLDSSFRSSRQQALRTGNQAPELVLAQSAGIWPKLPAFLRHQEHFSVRQLAQQKSFAVSFYSPYWQDYGDIHLSLLRKMYRTLQETGHLLLLIASVPVEDLRFLVNQYELLFPVYADPTHQLAEKFGVYSIHHPVWERISGISEEVPVPATFVVNNRNVITYDAVDEDFCTLFSMQTVINSLTEKQ